MKDLIKVDNKELMIKEWKGQRVVTAWDISKLHEREVREVIQQFERNKKRLLSEEDYFIIPKEKISESQIVIQDFIPNNVKEIPVFTESGYLMLVKTFTDDLSWKIQRMLVKSYFKLKETIKKIPEITEYQLKNQKIRDRYSRAKLSKEFLEIAKTTNNPLFKEVLTAYAGNTLADENILPLPRLEQKTYTATEIGNMLGISATKVGKIANEHNLKTDDYGYYVSDKSKYSNKQVESFRYFEHCIDKFKNLI